MTPERLEEIRRDAQVATRLPGIPAEIIPLIKAYSDIVTELLDACSSQQERIKELEGYMEQLKTPASVHSNILSGRIVLTKAQAIHIAGLPADIEERIKEMRGKIPTDAQIEETCKGRTSLKGEYLSGFMEGAIWLRERIRKALEE